RAAREGRGMRAGPASTVVEDGVERSGSPASALARSLRSKRTNTLALLLTDITNPFFTTLARGVVTDLLRGDLDFEGVCFSDDLQMKAISDRYAVEQSAVLAIEAGCDGLLICTDPDAQERARLALEQRAAADADFAARLREAHERMTAMRRLAPLRPVRDPAALRALLDHAGFVDLVAEIARRAPA
ncbi:MAG: glycoside hydrolase family 3 N-terminal domain-containing protein, partial [Deltaproteobacteria bacterium]